MVGLLDIQRLTFCVVLKSVISHLINSFCSPSFSLIQSQKSCCLLSHRLTTIHVGLIFIKTKYDSQQKSQCPGFSDDLSIKKKKKKSYSMLRDSHRFNLLEKAFASLGQEIKIWAAWGGGGMWCRRRRCEMRRCCSINRQQGCLWQ